MSSSSISGLINDGVGFDKFAQCNVVAGFNGMLDLMAFERHGERDGLAALHDWRNMMDSVNVEHVAEVDAELPALVR